jgi:hypothetical protein
MEISNKNSRKEYKFLFSKKEIYKLKTFYGEKLEKLYPSRTIKSLYMDTTDLDLYKLSKQTDVNKYKVRFRTYPKKDTKIYREIKSNKDTGKEKTTELTEYKSLQEIKFEVYKNYLLSPCLFIKYDREYFKLDSVARLTIDTNLQFKLPKNISLLDKYIVEDFYIVELKLLNNMTDLTEYFINSPIAFSKYEYGVEKLFSSSFIQY